MKSDPGLGSKYNKEIKRLLNKDGSYNMIRHGALGRFKDFYKYLIEIPWWTFFTYTLLYYLVINVLFALLFLLAGVDGITGTNTEHPDFFEAFFFSVQTITSVGYGQMSPISLPVNIVAAIESFIGIISIALVTGLFYGRFSRPKSKIAFSQNILFTPYKDGNAIMFKLVNKRDVVLLNAAVKVILIIDRGGEKNQFNKMYHELELEVNSVNFFPLTWTIVHGIDDASPLARMSFDEITSRNTEVLILIEAFDETHSQNIVEKHAYGADAWKTGVKFDRNFRINENGILELFIDELDNTLPIENQSNTM